LFRDLYSALAVKKLDTPVHKAHPLFKSFGLILIFVISVTADQLILIITLVIVLLEMKIGHVLYRIKKLVRSMFLPIMLISIMTYLFYGLMRTIEIIIRINIIAFSTMLFIATTAPFELSQMLEKYGFPSKFSIITELSLKMIPMVLKDAEDAYVALYLRGEIGASRFSFKGIIKILAILIAIALRRSNYLIEALMAKYYGAVKKRTILYDFRVNTYSVVQLIAKFCLLVLLISSNTIVAQLHIPL